MGKMKKYELRARFMLTWKEFVSNVPLFLSFIFWITITFLFVGAFSALFAVPAYYLGSLHSSLAGLLSSTVAGTLAGAGALVFSLHVSTQDNDKIDSEIKRLRLRDENNVLKKTSDKRGALTESEDSSSGGLTISS